MTTRTGQTIIAVVTTAVVFGMFVLMLTNTRNNGPFWLSMLAAVVAFAILFWLPRALTVICPKCGAQMRLVHWSQRTGKEDNGYVCRTCTANDEASTKNSP